MKPPSANRSPGDFFGQTTPLFHLMGIAMALTIAAIVLLLPPAATIVPLVAAAVSGALFARPAMALTVAISLRTIVDLAWGVSVGPVNAIEAYSGAAVVALMILIVFRVAEVARGEMVLPAMLFAALLALGLVRDPGADTAAVALRLLIPWLLILAIPALFRDVRAVRLLLAAIAIASLPAVASSLAFGLTGRRYVLVVGVSRLAGGYHNVTEHACAMLIFTVLGAYFATTARRNWVRALSVAYGAATMMNLYLSATRAAFVGLVVALGSFLALTGRRRLFGLSIIAVVVLLSQGELLTDRFSDLMRDAGAPSGFIDTERSLGSGRYWVWKTTFQEFLRSDALVLMLGRGLGKASENVASIDPHMDALFLLYQLGPIGLGLWVWAGARALANGARAAGSSDAELSDISKLLVALATGCVATSMLTNGYLSRAGLSFYFGAILGCLFVTGVVGRNMSNKAPSRAALSTAPERKEP